MRICALLIVSMTSLITSNASARIVPQNIMIRLPDNREVQFADLVYDVIKEAQLAKDCSGDNRLAILIKQFHEDPDHIATVRYMRSSSLYDIKTRPTSWADSRDPLRGSSSTVFWNPNTSGLHFDMEDEDVFSDAQANLIHELIHAARMAKGESVPDLYECDPNSDEYFPDGVIALENIFRRSKHIQNRRHYCGHVTAPNKACPCADDGSICWNIPYGQWHNGFCWCPGNAKCPPANSCDGGTNIPKGAQCAGNIVSVFPPNKCGQYQSSNGGWMCPCGQMPCPTSETRSCPPGQGSETVFACIDGSSDAANCGGCGTVCQPGIGGYECRDGHCTFSKELY